MRPQPTRSRRGPVAAARALGLAFGLAFAAGAAAAPAPNDVRFGRHPGYWRIALEWAEPTATTVDLRPGEVVLAPLAAGEETVARIRRRLGAVVRHVARDGGGLHLLLRDGVQADAVGGLDPRILAVDFRRAEEPSDVARAALVPRRRPPSTPPTVRPFPVEAAPSPPANPRSPAAGATTPEREPAAADAGPDTAEAIETERRGLDAAATPGLPPLPPTDDAVPAIAASRVDVPPAPQTVGGDERAARRGDAAAPPAAAAAPAEAPAAPNEAQADPPDVTGTTPAGAEAATAGDGDGAVTAPQGAPPAAEPPAPRLQIIADGGELVFRFPRAVDAAAWRRGGHLWLVFAPVPADLVLPTTVPAAVERVPHAEALIWRVRVPATAPRRIEGEGATWRVVEAPPQATAPSTAPEGTTPIALEDPWLGELWQVVPRPPGAGGTRASRPDGARLWLPTLHGARFRDLSARPRDPGDRRGHPGGLTAPLPRPELGPLFGLAAPSLPPAAAAERRRELETSLFADPVPARRLALARFLLGEAAPFDALAVLDAATAAPNDEAAAARLDALTGVAAVLAGRPDRAEPLLPPAGGADAAPERWLWRAMLAAAREDWGAAGEAFARSGQLWRDYPLPLRRLVALRAARAALALDAPQVALAVLHRVEPGAPAGGVTGRLALLHARALAAAGDLAAARAELDALTGDGVAPPIARHARLARVELDHAAGELDDAGARAALEPDVLGWTGRDDAARFWRFLAARRAATGDGRGAFEAWRRADADDVDDRRRAVLDALVAGEAPFADALADAVILLERRLELFAEGPARAERLRTLAGRVASETDALHVADRLYRRALAEPLPHALAVDLRVELAELRLERQLPHAAVAALQPLGGGLDPHVDALRRRAEALREGRPPPAPAAAEAAEAAAARAPADFGDAADGGDAANGGDAAETELRRVLETVDETLEETRRLLDDDAAAAPDGS